MQKIGREILKPNKDYIASNLILKNAFISLKIVKNNYFTIFLFYIAKSQYNNLRAPFFLLPKDPEMSV